MPYLNLDLDYFEHRKTVRLIGLLGRGAEVLPIKLWRYCGKFHAEDGKLIGYSQAEIEAQVGWWGKPGEAVAALCDDRVRYLRKIDNGFEAVDWLEHQGHLKMFKERARTAANTRWGNASSNASGMPQAIHEQCPVPTNQPIKAKAAREEIVTDNGPQFERDFWDQYPPIPNKANANKRKAEAEWVKLAPELQSQAVAAVRVFAAVVMAQPANRRVKLIGPVAFLDNRCFSTDPAAWDPEYEPPKVENRPKLENHEWVDRWFKWVGDKQIGPFDTRAEAETA